MPLLFLCQSLLPVGGVYGWVEFFVLGPVPATLCFFLILNKMTRSSPVLFESGNEWEVRSLALVPLGAYIGND